MRASGTPTNDFLSGKRKVVKINLNNPLTIRDILKAIPDASDITTATGIAIERLCQHGEDYAKMIVPIDTGELMESITHEVVVVGSHVTGTITAGTDHAMFVEFGTGIKGRGSNYPLDGIQWVYDYKEQNWEGFEARPFMYTTARELEEHAAEIITGVYK